MSNEFGFWIIALIVAAVIGIWVFSWLYHRGGVDRAFVRTGWGGRKIAIEGGMIVIPILHEVTSVNLGLSRAHIHAAKEDALITYDHMRVDVTAEIFLRVAANKEGVAKVAATLGKLANQPQDLATFFESEFFGALHTVAATRSMDSLHEDRAGFATAVQKQIAPILARSGIELESIAIRNLNQTALEYFNPANRFDAEGLTKLIETVEERRKQRSEIEQMASLAIKETNLKTEKESLVIERESQLAKLNQEREIETRRIEQSTDIAREKAMREADAEAVRIEANQRTNQQEISAKEEVERARLKSERSLDESRIAREKDLRRLEIERETAVELAKIDNSIMLIQKSLAEAKLRIESEEKLSKGAKASEAVKTMHETSIAKRELEVSNIQAEKDAKAQELRAHASAEAERLRNEAENILSHDARQAKLRSQLIDKLELIIRETVRPIEKIDGIKVIHMGGTGQAGSAKSPTDEVIDSALRYRVQAPMIDELLKDIGVEGANISKMGDVFRAAKDAQSLAKTNVTSITETDNDTLKEKKESDDG